MTIALLVCLDLAAMLYWRGAVRMPGALPRRRAASFYVGLVVLAGALSSPVESRAGTRLSAHMVQHLVLLLVAPALIAYGRPVVVTLLALPLRARRAIGRLERAAAVRKAKKVVGHPVTAWALVASVLWTWHQPDLYQAAVGGGVVHALEHATFFGAALVFWRAVIDAGPRRRVSYGAALLLVFGTLVQSGWLAMVLSFAPQVVYPVYGDGPQALADQQLAGVIMWVPMTAVFVVAIVALFVRFFGALDARVRRDEARDAIGAPT
jgi:putative membrane protein